MKIHNGNITEPGTYDYEVVTGFVYTRDGGKVNLPLVHGDH